MSAGGRVEPDEGEHEAAELCRFLQVHDVTCAFDYDAADIRYARLDGSRMRVNIWKQLGTRPPASVAPVQVALDFEGRTRFPGEQTQSRKLPRPSATGADYVRFRDRIDARIGTSGLRVRELEKLTWCERRSANWKLV